MSSGKLSFWWIAIVLCAGWWAFVAIMIWRLG
jgi:hypothetical protein